MTQERKDQLYDQMIAWICEHISNDEDLFLTLHGHFGMTKEELHDHCIESLDAFFPENDPKTLLKQDEMSHLQDRGDTEQFYEMESEFSDEDEAPALSM